jgi:probable DNA metabolism protein
MSDRSAVAYLYDGTFEGLMTAVFEAYAHRPMPDAIWEAAGYQPQFGERTMDVAVDEAKADRVIAGIRRTMGPDAYERVWTAFRCEQRERGQWIYDYVRLGMEAGRRIDLMLTDDRVIRLHKWSGLVSLESARFVQFVRFSQREGGVYYAGIEPEYDVVALMMPHFADRLRTQPFIIHDKNRNLYGVYDTKEWYITYADEAHIPAITDKEADYRRLWKTFYDTVAIQERINPRCRRQHMPKKYWKNITEMTMGTTEETAAGKRGALAAEKADGTLPARIE